MSIQNFYYYHTKLPQIQQFKTIFLYCLQCVCQNSGTAQFSWFSVPGFTRWKSRCQQDCVSVGGFEESPFKLMQVVGLIQFLMDLRLRFPFLSYWFKAILTFQRPPTSLGSFLPSSISKASNNQQWVNSFRFFNFL